MENQANQPPKPANKALWIILILVVLALAGYGVYAYVSGKANTNQNTNVVANANTNIATNTNSTANTNSAAISNVNTNATPNSNTDTSAWKTYENKTYGYTVKYPSDWEVFVLTSIVTEFAPQNNPYYLEGSKASPIHIVGYIGSANDYLKGIPDNQKSSLGINEQSAIKIQKDLTSESYVFTNQRVGSYAIIGTDSDLMRNIEATERDKIESIFNSLLKTFQMN